MKFSVKDLTVGYHKKPLIENIQLEVEEGSILCLLGPNGCGKSTILKTLTRHLKKLGGTVYLGKEDLHQLSGKEAARRQSVVLTDRIAPELMTCREVVAGGRYPYTNVFGRLTAKDREKIQQALEAVNAQDLADQEFSTLSDGQKQRILLARAICQEPEVIVLDEPTSYLDIRYKLDFMNILRQMALEQGITVILSLHEVELAARLADKLLLIKDQKIFRYGSPEDILDDQTIQELYALPEGRFNALLGTMELGGIQGEPSAFILGGGGRGIPFYRAFHKRGLSFSTGILFENDIDYVVGRGLATKVVFAESFQPVPLGAFDEAVREVERCRILLDSGAPIGDLNWGNQLLIEEALKLGDPVLSIRDKEDCPAGVICFPDIDRLLKELPYFIEKMRKELEPSL